MAAEQEISQMKTFVSIPTRNEEPRIDVLKEEGAVRVIRISCSCGCEVDINCQYDQDKNDE